MLESKVVSNVRCLDIVSHAFDYGLAWLQWAFKQVIMTGPLT